MFKRLNQWLTKPRFTEDEINTVVVVISLVVIFIAFCFVIITLSCR